MVCHLYCQVKCLVVQLKILLWNQNRRGKKVNNWCFVHCGGLQTYRAPMKNTWWQKSPALQPANQSRRPSSPGWGWAAGPCSYAGGTSPRDDNCTFCVDLSSWKWSSIKQVKSSLDVFWPLCLWGSQRCLWRILDTGNSLQSSQSQCQTLLGPARVNQTSLVASFGGFFPQFLQVTTKYICVLGAFPVNGVNLKRIVP